MPRAFLMQYKKKQESGVIYQEADTTEEKHKKQNENIKLVMDSYEKHTSDEEEEISVTDSEDSTEEDQEEHMDDLNSDDHEPNFDENDHFDDEEECEETDDEEINIDEISDEEDVDDSNKAIFTPNFHQISHNHHLRCEENSDDKAADENLNFMSSQERLERNMNKIGSKHSAFTKPALGEAEANKERFVKMSNDHRDNLPHYGMPFSGVMDPNLSVSNYWHHMSKRYGFGMPYPPFPHPLGMTGFSSGALPMESLHPELLYRQMLHNQMLYYSQQNMINPSHPMHRMFQYPLEMPHVTKSQLNNINKTTQDSSSESRSKVDKQSSEKVTTISKQENKNDNSSKNGTLKEETKVKYDNSNLYSPLQSPSTVSSSQLKLPVAAMTSSSTSHTSSSPLINNQRLNFPSPSTTTTLPSPITPPGTFGNGAAMPFGYGNIFGSRRPRDPNRPPPVKKYKCDLCPKAFSRSNTLVTHRRIHTGEKPFKCEICNRAFRQPGNLTRHRLTHTSVKPFVCVVCKKAFNRASNLQTHMRTHNAFRPFACPCCGKGFQQKVDLKMHMYTHGNVQ